MISRAVVLCRTYPIILAKAYGYLLVQIDYFGLKVSCFIALWFLLLTEGPTGPALRGEIQVLL